MLTKRWKVMLWLAFGFAIVGLCGIGILLSLRRSDRNDVLYSTNRYSETVEWDGVRRGMPQQELRETLQRRKIQFSEADHCLTFSIQGPPATLFFPTRVFFRVFENSDGTIERIEAMRVIYGL